MSVWVPLNMLRESIKAPRMVRTNARRFKHAKHLDVVTIHSKKIKWIRIVKAWMCLNMSSDTAKHARMLASPA